MAEFRLLKADEIDVRVATISKDNSKALFLLYKDARADMTILDECVGCMNWKREHTRDNQNCIVSIYDPDKNEWVSKEDTGVESFTEKEKGLASDSFKRACVNWGIGRELYTSPNIWIQANQGEDIKYLTLRVCAIHYTNRKIDAIVLVDRYNNVRYSMNINIIVDEYLANNAKAKAYFSQSMGANINHLSVLNELLRTNKI